ncbi:MAG: tRNA preQ1(34) S-adenosylmethionine ribosyltransferase-isomerase QueA [Legionellales bacterium]|nr:tRNA preQ1(34) S-adenosylmethionine ribosyltransferase-isomerase QueA [Legionellales bacterium]
MKTQDFNFELPPELIAQYPLPVRSDSRLLVYDAARDHHAHQLFKDIVSCFEPGDLLVMNDSQVIPARLYGTKATGGKVEFLVERILGFDTFLAHIKASKSPKAGMLIHLNSDWRVEMVEKQDDLYLCQLNGDVLQMLQHIGHIPLPPYITRADDALDSSRYQTIYARHKGSVAAPTAGLHFDERVMAELKSAGINVGYLTLHVGAGTFRPVRTEWIAHHKMHFERITVSEELCALVKETRALGKRVIAVGTTALRSLESAAVEGELKPCHRETDIFIQPGYSFQICNGLVTNFHLPESTLLMLVSAFIGHKQAMSLYQMAIAAKYRFFSYGDTSLLLR